MPVQLFPPEAYQQALQRRFEALAKGLRTWVPQARIEPRNGSWTRSRAP